MAYVKNTWVDQKVQRPKTYNFTTNDDGSTTLIDAFGNVEELGTPVNADNMNHIEDGLTNVGIWTYSDTITYDKDDAVIGIVDDNFVLCRSLKNGNKGNALTNTEFWQVENFGGGSGLEVCDIGTALYIDETKGLRRRLNGQIVDANTNTQGFIDKLIEIKETNPDYFTDEDTWQSEKTMNVDGCVYKFVLNYDSTGTNVISVRLPKYPDYVEVTSNNIPVAGNGITLGVTNGTGTSGLIFGTQGIDNRTQYYGAPVGSDVTIQTYLSAGKSVGLTTEPDKSGIQTSGGITKLKLIYFIQIATGAETENNIINDIELNNPFVFGMNLYYKGKMNNISWLKSVGQQNNKALCPDFYNWILENVNKGVSGFLGQTMYMFGSADGGYYCSTQTPQVGAVLYGSANNNTAITATVTKVYDNGNIDISDFSLGISYTSVGRYPTSNKSSADYITDYDFEINTTDETFRLPLKNGNEHIPDYSKGTVITSTNAFIVPSNGIVAGTIDAGSGASKNIIVNGQKVEGVWGGKIAQDGCPFYAEVKKGDSVVIERTTINDGFAKPTFYPFVGNGSLYYYVGETVQNANLIVAGRIGENLASKLDTPPRYPVEVSDKSLMPSWYVVYNDGWCEQGGRTGSVGNDVFVNFLKTYSDVPVVVGLGTIIGGVIDGAFSIYNLSTIGFQTHWAHNNVPKPISWQASGYIN